jgi:hypothetical protein
MKKPSAKTWWIIGIVFLVVVIMWPLVRAEQAEANKPTIMSGVTKSKTAKLDDSDGVKVKIDAPAGKYIVFATKGYVFQVAKVKNGKYTYTDVADENSYRVKAYTTDEKLKRGDKTKKLTAYGSVEFKIPVENITDSDDDYSDSDDSDYTDDETDSDDSDYTDSDTDSEDSVSDDSSTKTYRTDVTYENLARTPDDYELENFTMTGKVLQVIEDDDSDTVEARVGINGDYDDVVLIEYDSSIMNGSRVLEDDKITFSGTSMGTTTYESTMGGDITIPSATVDKIVDSGTAPSDYGY